MESGDILDMQIPIIKVGNRSEEETKSKEESEIKTCFMQINHAHPE